MRRNLVEEMERAFFMVCTFAVHTYKLLLNYISLGLERWLSG